MNEDRLIELESKLAHQELLLDQLNAVVTDQQTRIDRLNERCDSLLTRVRSIGEGGDEPASPDAERPPHY